jgi:hypothetical protein
MRLFQIKVFAHIKRNSYRNQELTQRIEKISTSYSTDKGLIVRIYTELKKLNSKRTNNPVRKGQIN